MSTAKKGYEFSPDYAVAPGMTLLEVIESKGMSKKEFAQRMGLTEQSVNRILKGEQPITYETANKLELVTGVPARMWNNLEAQYREQLELIAEKERLKADLEWLKEIPVNELKKRNLIEDSNDKMVVLRSVLKFYGVSSVDVWKNRWATPEVAARRSDCFETRMGPASAWIRMGETKAESIDCQPYSKDKFKESLEKIRKITNQSPERFEPKLRELCAEAGVAVVIVPEIKKVPWNGASKWLSSEKAMIVLNIRGRYEDKFWFSFFHEAGHILNDKKKFLYINTGKNSDDEKENKADQFAAETLIPDAYNAQIQKCVNASQLRSIAKELGISPGIVAGRWQFLNSNYKQFNNLKTKFEYKDSAA